MLHFIFISSSFHLLFLFFFSSFPSSSPLLSSLLSPPLFLFFFLLISSSSFHPPHFILYRNPTFCYFSYPFFHSTFYHHLFDVMRLQRYAFIGQMTLLSSKSSRNPDDGGKRAGSAHVEFNMKNDGGRRDRSAHVNLGTSTDIGAL